MLQLQLFVDYAWDELEETMVNLYWPTLTQEDLNREFNNAMITGDIRRVYRFLRRGADINSKNSHGYGCLHMAVKLGHSLLFSQLVEYGADVEMQTIFDGYRPLHLLVKSPNKNECLEHLLAHKVDLNSVDNMKNTVLHHMITVTPEIEINEFPILLAKCMRDGLNIDSQDGLGDTALHIATKRGNSFIVDVLLQDGARLDIVNEHGFTAFESIPPERNDIQIMYLKNMAIRVNRGQKISRRIMEKIQKNRIMQCTFWMYCDELIRLQAYCVSSSPKLTFFDILCKNKETMASYLKIPEVADRFHFRFYSYYATEIDERIKEINVVYKKQKKAFNLVNELLSDKLPYLCIKLISEYLACDNEKYILFVE